MASVTVDVGIDEFDDADVVMEAKQRGYRVTLTPEQMQRFNKWSCDKIRKLDIELDKERPAKEDLADLLDCLKSRRYDDAIALVEALMFPKFKTLTECEEKYKKLRVA